MSKVDALKMSLDDNVEYLEGIAKVRDEPEYVFATAAFLDGVSFAVAFLEDDETVDMARAVEMVYKMELPRFQLRMLKKKIQGGYNEVLLPTIIDLFKEIASLADELDDEESPDLFEMMGINDD